jgi:hypothetical protein
MMQTFAEAWAKRLGAGTEEGGARVRAAYRQAFGREPTAGEMRATKEFFERFGGGGGAWVAFCQAVLASAEFRMLN